MGRSRSIPRSRMEQIDYQIGVTTTGTRPGKKPGCLIGAPGGIVSGCTHMPEQAFAAILDKVGIACSSAEMGLEAAYLASSPPAAPLQRPPTRSLPATRSGSSPC